jgi:hypothetical protein
VARSESGEPGKPDNKWDGSVHLLALSGEQVFPVLHQTLAAKQWDESAVPECRLDALDLNQPQAVDSRSDALVWAGLSQSDEPERREGKSDALDAPRLAAASEPE